MPQGRMKKSEMWDFNFQIERLTLSFILAAFRIPSSGGL
jgi:hypothetical protein